MQFFLNLLRLFVARLWLYASRFRGCLYRLRAIARAWYYQCELNLPTSCGLHVPLVVNGNGRVVVGDQVSIGYRKAPILGSGHVMLQARDSSSIVEIGAGTTTSNNISIVALSSIRIGEGCQVGDQVTIFDADFHEICPETRNRTHGQVLPVSVGKNVWLGSRVMILKGVSIGDHSVIAAGSVVTTSIPSRCIAAGVPAKVIRSI